MGHMEGTASIPHLPLEACTLSPESNGMHNILRINATQWVTAYPETIPSCLEQLPPRLPAREAQHASVRPLASRSTGWHTALEALAERHTSSLLARREE